ncbi:APC family permease [Clostridium rectalis]|uniref:APC family permease n=1 Tax=Clostridium rectalis TaxID=2040295 RepID=UPI000F634D4F|nr:amino acid permease [Clostridium rectalis]
MEEREEVHLKKGLGLVSTTAIVVGNTMGSGILLLVAALAKECSPGAAMVGWIISGLGAIFMGISFANLGAKIPKTGGPYEYVKQAFGDFAGYINAWLFWNSYWIAIIASLVSATAYVAAFIPVLNENRLVAFLFTSAVLWFFTYINVKGIKEAATFQTILTASVIVLSVAFVFVAGGKFNISNITPLFPEGKGIGTVSAAVSITLWAFSGFEAASVSAGEVKNARRNVKLATIIGILISIAFYLILSFATMGAINSKELAMVEGNYGEILSSHFGRGFAYVVIITEVLSILGTAFATILTTARMSYAAAKDDMFPRVFQRVHSKYQTPSSSLIIAAILGNILLAMNYTKSLSQLFTFMILLSNLSCLPIYACTSLADIKLWKKDNKGYKNIQLIKYSIIPLLGFAYAMWAIYGSGVESFLYCLVLTVAGLPLFFYKKKKAIHANKLEELNDY